MDNKRFIVYMHISPSNKRYIGITYRKPLYRWHKDGSGYKDNQYFWRAIQKYGWNNFEHKIIAEDLYYEDACKLEIELIQKYNTTDELYGYNLSSGGELHSLGCKRTEEQRKRYSLSKMGDRNPQFGKPSWNKGIPMSEESKLKLSLSHMGKTFKCGPMSEERKQHLHDINVGKIYVNNGEIEKCICKDELETYLNMGYVRGYIKTRRWKNVKKKEKN